MSAGARCAAVAIGVAALVHVYVVVGLLRQPLDVNARPDPARVGQRSPIWPLHNDTVHRQGPAGDFFGVYHAGVLARRGLSTYAGVEAEQPRVTPYTYPYRYLPAVGHTFGRVWTLLPPEPAYRVWIVVLELVLLALLLALVRGCPSVAFGRAAALILLLSSPYFLELHMGQYTFLTVACVACAALLVERLAQRPGGSWLAGAGATGAFVVGAVLKVIPLVTLPAIWRRSRVVAVVGFALFLLVAAPPFVERPDDLVRFYQFNFSHPVGGMDGGNHGLVYLGLMTASDLGLSWVVAHWYPIARGFQALLILGAAALVMTRRHPRADLGAATLLLAHFATYVHVWEHHISGVVVLGLLIARRAACDGRRRAMWVALVATGLLALPTPYALFDVARDPRVWDPSASWPAYARYACLLSKAAPTVVLLGTGVVMQLRERDGDARPATPASPTPAAA